MTAAASGDQGNLPFHRRVCPGDKIRTVVDFQKVTVGRLHTCKRFLHNVARLIDKLLHSVPPRI